MAVGFIGGGKILHQSIKITDRYFCCSIEMMDK